MIVPLGSPDNVDLTVWVVQCNQCGIQSPIEKTGDWLLTDAEFDVHYCPTDAAALAKKLIDSATPRRRVPLPLAVAALIGVGVLTLRNIGH